MQNYKKIEDIFKSLISELQICLSTHEVNEIKEFVCYSEYGIALETLVDIIIEENKIINQTIKNKIISLSIEMNQEQNLEKKLNKLKIT